MHRRTCNIHIHIPTHIHIRLRTVYIYIYMHVLVLVQATKCRYLQLHTSVYAGGRHGKPLPPRQAAEEAAKTQCGCSGRGGGREVASKTNRENVGMLSGLTKSTKHTSKRRSKDVVVCVQFKVLRVWRFAAFDLELVVSSIQLFLHVVFVLLGLLLPMLGSRDFNFGLLA